jgi:hypothetical protein
MAKTGVDKALSLVLGWKLCYLVNLTNISTSQNEAVFVFDNDLV